MATWNDVDTILQYDPSIVNFHTVSALPRTCQAAVSTESGQTITMLIDNSLNEHWLQLMTLISDTATPADWQNAGWILRETAAIGLTQIGDGIGIRHAILLPHADLHAITNGITITAHAAAFYHRQAS